MSIEDSTPKDLILEDTEADTDMCLVCESENSLRAIAGYENGACWVIFCADCGRTIEERWNILP